MKVIISRNELTKSLAKVQGIVERRNTLPILSYVLFTAGAKGVEMVSTDLEVGLKASYDARVEETGSVTMMAKKVFEIARELPEEEVVIESGEGERVRITSGNANFRLVGLSKDEFPQMPEYRLTGGLSVTKASILEMVQKTSFAISHDQTRYALNGVLFEATTQGDEEGNQICRMVATDGHRLAMVERYCLRGNTEDRSVIIPRKAVQELKRVLEDEEGETIQLDFSANHVFFIGKRVVLTARLIEGQFPEYRQVIPKESSRRAVMDREEFARVLRRISILTPDRNNPTRFSFEDGTMTISINNPDVGEASESMAVTFDGEPLELGFNARYMLDVLGAVEGEQVSVQMNEPLSPGLVTIEGDSGYRYVLMPMRL